MPQSEDCFEEGFESYTFTDLSDNPYPEGSSNWNQWNMGWMRAAAQDTLAPDDYDEGDDDAEYEYA